MEYGLPRSVEINGEEFEIRSDFRVILDIFEILNDPDITNNERALFALQIFYLDFDSIPDYNAALREMFQFINCGKAEKNEKKKQPKLVDWVKDYQYIIPPVNRVIGYEVRDVPYDPESNTGGVHWWTFIGAYMEIGDCMFAQIVGIRSKKAKGKKLDKSDREFYRQNREIIDFETHYTDAENELLAQWLNMKS